MKSKYCVLILLLICFNKISGFAQLPDSIKSHIDSSLFILKQHSLYAGRVNWNDIQQKVYDSAKSATTKAETFAALTIVFKALGDKHAAYYQYDDQYKIDNSELMARYSDSIKVAWSRGPGIISRVIDNVAYINIPFMGVNKQKDIDKYANWIYDAVIALQAKKAAAWIIDLRLNGGGNIRPMLAGLAMFFKDGIVSCYIDRNGNATDEAAFRSGDFVIDGVKQATIKNKIPALKPVKVAVLTGPGTASSGEGVAVVFGQRKNTRLFGERSAGLANATNGFVFDNNKAYFLISTAYIGDKQKNILPESVMPDVIIKGNDAFGNIENDIVVKEALKWLKQ
ncbi:MAG: S41 family peptidase [Agriterribacter sp.]